MDPQAIFQKIKDATVAMAIFQPHNRKHPYEVIGTGFCIHPRGVIVTCSHVLSAFCDNRFEAMLEEVRSKDPRAMIPGKQLGPIRQFGMIIPYAIFCCRTDSSRYIFMAPIPFEAGVNIVDADLCVGRIGSHTAFAQGYPTIDIADYSDLYEGMDIGTCGFPLGNLLADQLGTITSSFTKGILSSFIPGRASQRQAVGGFQLNLTATHGNSGGPVFAWQTGSVFGVLSSGPVDHRNEVLPGLAKAMPIWKAFDNTALELVLNLKQGDPSTWEDLAASLKNRTPDGSQEGHQ